MFLLTSISQKFEVFENEVATVFERVVERVEFAHVQDVDAVLNCES